MSLSTEVSDSNAREDPAGDPYKGQSRRRGDGGELRVHTLSRGPAVPGAQPTSAEVKGGPTVVRPSHLLRGAGDPALSQAVSQGLHAGSFTSPAAREVAGTPLWATFGLHTCHHDY